MPKEKVPIQVNTDDAYLLAAPPRSVKRSRVRLANEKRYRHSAVAVAKSTMRPQSGQRAFDWVWVLHDG
jgi:hypothetical protein